MKQMNFAGGGGAGPQPRRARSLAPVERQLLWSLRHIAQMRPIGSARSHSAHAALQRDFADAGLVIEHLLRCWLFGLAQRSATLLRFNEPACPLLSDDEARLFGVLRAAADEPARAALLLAGFGTAAPALLPLFVAVVAAVASVDQKQR
jgi:hypothetical protein